MMKKQQGSALIIGLIMLIGLMLIGVSSVQTTSINYRAISNFKNIQVSFQSAESGLSQAEDFIESQASKPKFCSKNNTSDCTWVTNSYSDSDFLSGSAWKSSQSAEKIINTSSTQPQYIIQEQGFQAFELSPNAQSQGQGIYYYKVTAVGYGSKTRSADNQTNEASETIVESVFAKSF